ncbi:MAG: hypothetical protein PHQ12_05830 [Chthoniobacteraceae bacterium]|nr:hypothetical protein [Chthoniobacteraceae bacterium]
MQPSLFLRRHLPLAAALCLALFAAPFAAPADPAPSPATTATAAPTAKPRPFPFQSVIVSVDPAARTFRMGKKVIHQVHILPETKITRGDTVPAAFETLTPGMEIRGAVRKRADGDYDAVSVKIGPKEKPGA